jgi:hypothetical protein
MTELPIRTAGFLSMAFASVSVLYSVILILHLPILRNQTSAPVEDMDETGQNAEEISRVVSRRQTNGWSVVSIHLIPTAT